MKSIVELIDLADHSTHIHTASGDSATNIASRFVQPHPSHISDVCRPHGSFDMNTIS